MTGTAPQRLWIIDAARGLAVLAMFAFHFTWDLGHFRYIDAAVPYSAGFKAFGHTIAFAFLFIAGLSLVLAHGDGPRWPSFWRRLAMVTGAALLVSVGTYAVFPNAFVFFGILHCIAASSLLAAPFLFLPWPAALIAATAAAMAPHFARDLFFDAPQWWWTGLSTFEPLTNDYRPLLPWMSATLAGIGAMKAWRQLPLPVHGERAGVRGRGFFSERTKEPRDLRKSSASKSIHQAPHPSPLPASGKREKGGAVTRPHALEQSLTVLGRHSLLLYLAHQPLFFAAFSAAALLAQPPVADEMRSFANACETQCIASHVAADTCRAACACTAERVARQNSLARVTEDSERQRRIGAIARECLELGR